jgi:hypothetical protein
MHFYHFSKDNRRFRLGTVLRNALFVLAVLAYLGGLAFIILYLS